MRCMIIEDSMVNRRELDQWVKCEVDTIYVKVIVRYRV